VSHGLRPYQRQQNVRCVKHNIHISVHIKISSRNVNEEEENKQ
jgi:hypothetical protein